MGRPEALGRNSACFCSQKKYSTRAGIVQPFFGLRAKAVSKYIYRTRNTNGEWKQITKEELDSLSLDDGSGILSMHGDYTTINHYIGTFWCHILGAKTFTVLFQLLKHCYGNANRAWPSIQRLADLCGYKKLATIREALDELEKYGFIKIVQVFNQEKRTFESSVYIVRRTTPLISAEQYRELPAWLKREHDEYIAKLLKSSAVQVEEIPDYKNDEEIPFHRKRTSSSPALASESRTSVVRAPYYTRMQPGDQKSVPQDQKSVGNLMDRGSDQKSPPQDPMSAGLQNLMNTGKTEGTDQLSVGGGNEKSGSSRDDRLLPGYLFDPPVNTFEGAEKNKNGGGVDTNGPKKNINEKNTNGTIQNRKSFTPSYTTEEISRFFHQELRGRVHGNSYEVFFSRTQVDRLEGGVLYLITPYALAAHYIPAAYKSMICQLLTEGGIPCHDVVVTCANP